MQPASSHLSHFLFLLGMILRSPALFIGYSFDLIFLYHIIGWKKWPSSLCASLFLANSLPRGLLSLYNSAASMLRLPYRNDLQCLRVFGQTEMTFICDLGCPWLPRCPDFHARILYMTVKSCYMAVCLFCQNLKKIPTISMLKQLFVLFFF